MELRPGRRPGSRAVDLWRRGTAAAEQGGERRQRGVDALLEDAREALEERDEAALAGEAEVAAEAGTEAARAGGAGRRRRGRGIWAAVVVD